MRGQRDELWTLCSLASVLSSKILLRTELSEKVALKSESTRVVPEGFRGAGSDPGASEDARVSGLRGNARE